MHGGVAVFTVYRPGRLLWMTRLSTNLVVTAGLDLQASFLRGESPTPPSHLAVGDDDAISIETMDALQGTEHARYVLTPSGNGSEVIFSTQVTAFGTDKTIGEFGLFNAASAGTMFARWVTPAFLMPAGAVIDLTWRAVAAA